MSLHTRAFAFTTRLLQLLPAILPPAHPTLTHHCTTCPRTDEPTPPASDALQDTEPSPATTSTRLLPHPSSSYPPPFPGENFFGPGRSNIWVLLLRLRLIIHNYAEDQRSDLEYDPALRAARLWDDRLRASCTQFQLDQGWRGEHATGMPTQETWARLWHP